MNHHVSFVDQSNEDGRGRWKGKSLEDRAVLLDDLCRSSEINGEVQCKAGTAQCE